MSGCTYWIAIPFQTRMHIIDVHQHFDAALAAYVHSETFSLHWMPLIGRQCHCYFGCFKCDITYLMHVRMLVEFSQHTGSSSKYCGLNEWHCARCAHSIHLRWCISRKKNVCRVIDVNVQGSSGAMHYRRICQCSICPCPLLTENFMVRSTHCHAKRVEHTDLMFDVHCC